MADSAPKINEELFKMDLYRMLGVEERATDKEIITAYKKKSREVHPDKNPDNPKAGEQFHLLTQVVAILSSAPARAAYDRRWRALRQVEARRGLYDAKRRRLQDQLEANEAAHASKSAATDRQANRRAAARRENEAALERESAAAKAAAAQLSQRVAAEVAAAAARGGSAHVRLRWFADKTDRANGGYSEASLEAFLVTALGGQEALLALLVSGKRRGSALVELQSRADALRVVALATSGALGLPDNLLHAELVDDGAKGDAPTSCVGAPQAPLVDEADVLSRMFAAGAN